MSQRYLITLGWIAVIVLALYLRLNSLSDRPIHFDEATGARILAERLEGKGYQFNPEHFHGPTLSATTAPIARLSGEHTWSELSIHTLRISPVLAGLLTALTPLLWRKQLGALSALAAGAFLASSPLLVYYNRMYIHESWLALFGMVTIAAVFRFTILPKLANAAAGGFFIALMFATKASFAISLLSWGFSAGACWLFWLKRDRRQSPRKYLKPAFVLLSTSLIVSGVFYTDGLHHPQGIVDALKTYYMYETSPGHDKGYGYFLHLLVWPKAAVGIWWTEGIILILALAACIIAMRKDPRSLAVRFIAISFLAHVLIYSLISYKTPWLMLLPWAHACLLAGAAFSGFFVIQPLARITIGLLCLGGLFYQTTQSLAASGRFSSDARNPYAYVPTTKDPEKIKAWLEQLAELDNVELSPVAVCGKDYWPLPWYLRKVETVGYWPTPNETFTDYAVVFALPSEVAGCDALLALSHVKIPRGLRADLPLTLYLRNDIWDLWTSSTNE